MTQDILPFRPSDWVVNSAERVAQVKRVYRDGVEVLLDLVLYDKDGNRTGRESPACGGPRTFEPACDASGWERIERPSFPLEVHYVPVGDKQVLKLWAGKRLPPAEYRPIPPRAGGWVSENATFRRALKMIADGHNDARTLAANALSGKGGL